MERKSRLHLFTRWLILMAILGGLGLPPGSTALATSYVVDSLEDTNDGVCNWTAGDCTLREAINAANDTYAADTITFEVSGTITLTASLPMIELLGGMLNIDGTGRTVRISGNDAYRSFDVLANAQLTLRNLTVRDGYTTNSGAGVYNQGTLIVDRSTFTDNQADDNGGAIYSTGTLTITDSTFSNNIVNFGHGGAVYVDSLYKAVIAGSMFINNRTLLNGGAIYADCNSLTINETDILLNYTSGLDGGGIYNAGNLYMYDSALWGNSSARDGGGIYNSSLGQFHMENCAISYNNASQDGGGAVVDGGDYTSSFYACKFKNNSADQHGGAIMHVDGLLTVYSSVLEDNEAGGNGGAAYNQQEEFYLNNSTIESNSADVDGGGIYNRGDLSLSGCTLLENQAPGNGGGVYSDAAGVQPGISNSTFYDNHADRGGGLYSLSVMNIYNSAFVANEADTSGGAVCADLGTRLNNSIVADSVGSSNCSAPDGSGKPDNYGNNIDDGSSCGFGSVKGSMSNTDPLLGPLQDNGGLTETMFPQHNSPAIDGITNNPPNSCPGTDQRGYVRPYGGVYDIGPVEAFYGLFLPQVRK